MRKKYIRSVLIGLAIFLSLVSISHADTKNFGPYEITDWVDMSTGKIKDLPPVTNTLYHIIAPYEQIDSHKDYLIKKENFTLTIPKDNYEVFVRLDHGTHWGTYARLMDQNYNVLAYGKAWDYHEPKSFLYQGLGGNIHRIIFDRDHYIDTIVKMKFRYAGTYTFNAEVHNKGAITIFEKGNGKPTININTAAAVKAYGDNSKIEFQGTASDIENNSLKVSVKIGKAEKTLTVANNSSWKIEINTNEIGEGKFKDIVFSVSDGEDIITKTWQGTLDIKYTLKQLKNKIETNIPDKANMQRIVIVDSDDRIIDDNTENRTLINEIKSILEKKNISIYFIGGDNKVTKTLAGYFE